MQRVTQTVAIPGTHQSRMLKSPGMPCKSLLIVTHVSTKHALLSSVCPHLVVELAERSCVFLPGEGFLQRNVISA